MGDLARVVDHVAGDDRLFAPGRHMHAHVARRVSRRGQQRHVLVDLPSAGNQVRKARVEDRLHGIFDHRASVVGGLLAPVFPLRFGVEVAGGGEGGLPAAIDQARVPADVVHVHVRAEHRVHAVRVEAGRLEVVQEARLHAVPARIAAHFAVADASVDDDGAALGLHDQAVERHQQPAVAHEGAQPVDGGDVLRIGLGQDVVADARGLELHHPRDAHVADQPTQWLGLGRHGAVPRRRRRERIEALRSRTARLL